MLKCLIHKIVGLQDQKRSGVKQMCTFMEYKTTYLATVTTVTEYYSYSYGKRRSIALLQHALGEYHVVVAIVQLGELHMAVAIVQLCSTSNTLNTCCYGLTDKKMQNAHTALKMWCTK